MATTTTRTEPAQELAAARDRFIDLFKAQPDSREPEALKRVRAAAIERFAELGLPGRKDEEWRFTSLLPLARSEFRLAPDEPPALDASAIAPYVLPSASHVFVFVNGRFAPALSRLGDLQDGVRIAALSDLLASEPDSAEPLLARYAGYEDDAFAALSTAFCRDGLVVEIPRRTRLESDVQLLHVFTQDADGLMSFPRLFVSAGESAEGNVFETYAALGDVKTFTNPVTEIVAGDNVHINHHKLCLEAESAFHISRYQTTQGRDTLVDSLNVTFGSALVRNNVHAVLDDEGGDAGMNGLFLVSGRQHVDNHLRVEHAKPHCESREFYKGVLTDRGRGVFSGRIVVHKDAQKTDAKQTNANLLLSDHAHVDTKPQLEIFADDVKCTHAATIGQLDDDAIFYLRSRGVPLDTAKRLLIRSFAGEVFGELKSDDFREMIEQALRSRFPVAAIEPELR